jgi:aerobic carbon-monoxide dehydrogenase large subunit
MPGLFTRMSIVLEVSRWSTFPARREEAAGRGKRRGIGIVTYIEACGLAPSRIARQLGARGGLFESAVVRVNPSGDITVFTGSHSHG